MIITKNNLVFGTTPTITLDTSGEDPENLTNPDHSTNYTIGSNTDPFEVSFGAVSATNYVAVSGHNGGSSNNPMTVEVREFSTIIETVVINSNNNFIITFPEQSFTDLRVRFINTPNTYRLTISYIAAGQTLTVPNDGEQSGYNRNWLNRQTNQRTTGNLNAAPTALTQRRRPLRSNLSIPNALVSFSRGDWQTLLDSAQQYPFFVQEVETIPESTYICFNPRLDNAVRANPQRRALDSLSIRFDAYNGL